MNVNEINLLHIASAVMNVYLFSIIEIELLMIGFRSLLGAKCDPSHRQVANGILDSDAEFSAPTNDYSDRLYRFAEKGRSAGKSHWWERHDSHRRWITYTGKNLQYWINSLQWHTFCNISLHQKISICWRRNIKIYFTCKKK